MKYRVSTGIGALATAFALTLSGSPDASAVASCGTPTYSSGEVYFDCDTGATYIVFGRVYYSGTSQGWGVCYWDSDGSYSKGTWRGCQYYNGIYNPTKYVVRADGADLTYGGNDVVRLAGTVGSYREDISGTNWSIRREALPDAGDTYLFWGDRGNDYIYVCSVNNPTSSYCISSRGDADGRDGADVVYGGTTASSSLYGGPGNDVVRAGDSITYIYGGTGDDDLYGSQYGDAIFGLAGDDDVWAGTGDDYVWGGDGADYIYGGEGDDHIYGEADADVLRGQSGCDLIWGGETGTDNDYCYCEDSSGGANTGEAEECESTYYCAGLCI